MSNPIVVDRGGEPVLGLDSVLDFESTGRRQTSAKALHLMARGSHISGFVLRPDDGLSDVAIVSNGVTRFLSPAEMQWLMHESKSPITVAPAEELAQVRAELERLREAAWEVVWSWGEATGHADLPQCPMVARSAVEGPMEALAEALEESGKRRPEGGEMKPESGELKADGKVEELS